ncbi:MAG: FAD/NAD(P)-binding protein [Gammaproteobacteria bacterium]|nr:FAD/NAD(P)-binding protein [Gammaproteobacteria bacterium]
MFTLRLRFTDPDVQARYSFQPGQFNMLYLYGVGEVPISVVSDPSDETVVDHTIRALGRVTRALGRLNAGDRIGVRGPYGRGWPMREAEQRDVVIITGGLGCAPVVSVINYVLRRRERFGRLNIVQGVKHSNDFIWKDRYDRWRQVPNTRVLLAADEGAALWPWHVGHVTEVFDKLEYDRRRVIVMMCGPEGMMRAGVHLLREQGVSDEDIWVSMERNMHCAVGHCGHCQFGPRFVCRDGPVFRYSEIEWLFGEKGF